MFTKKHIAKPSKQQQEPKTENNLNAPQKQNKYTHTKEYYVTKKINKV